MNKIKETIENLKNSGKSEIEVINKVAELIEAEPIPVELYESLCFTRHKDLLKELKNTDQEIILTDSNHFLKAINLQLKGSKIFSGGRAGNTELEFRVFLLKGTGRLVFENLVLVVEDHNTLYKLVFSGHRELWSCGTAHMWKMARWLYMSAG